METVTKGKQSVFFKSLIMIRLDQDLFNFNFIYFNNVQINNNRKSLTMKNFMKIVSVYVDAFSQRSAHVWPIFDCYSNMPLFVYRIRDVILEFDIQNLRLVILYALLGISVIMVAHARFQGYLGAPANIFQTLKSCYVRNMFFFGEKKMKRLLVIALIIFVHVLLAYSL